MLRIVPGVPRVQQLGVNPRDRRGDLEAEQGVDTKLIAVETTGEGGAKNRAGRRNRHALAFAERATGPTGVEEPDGRAVLFELRVEHPRVDLRMLRQERLAEAGRKGRLRLGDADLRA